MIEILCTVAGIIAGVAVVGSLLRESPVRSEFQADAENEEPGRIKQIADQLQIISASVAANVSAHSDRVGHFSDQLEDENSDSEAVYTAIDEIISANKTMQKELAVAQKRIVEQSAMIEQASQQARTDALTGLANRRALDEHMASILEFKAEDGILGLLLMDIDHFKSFNDSFGHTTGDAVLASFARSMTQSSGADAFCARYGGEEFAVVLTAGSATKLVEHAAYIRRFVSEQVISYEDLQLKVTASAGLCVFTDADSAHAAFRRADEGLYKSKGSGRNQGHWLSDDGWCPFPDGAKPTEATTPPKPEAGESTGSCASQSSSTPDNFRPDDNSSSEQESVSSSSIASKTAATSEQDKHEEMAAPADLLDLNSFLEQLEINFEQLLRADMPGAALMLEAVGLSAGEKSEAKASWDEVVQLIQANLREDDVVCQYRRHTLCVFMGRCSQHVALERAARIQTSLVEARKTWQSSLSPKKLAIAIASIEQQEKCSQFLNRLESALEDARDVGDSQVVIHDGDSKICQDV